MAALFPWDPASPVLVFLSFVLESPGWRGEGVATLLAVTSRGLTQHLALVLAMGALTFQWRL